MTVHACAAQQDGNPAGCSKRPFSKAAGESKPEAYPQGYVEDFDELRTTLADFFSSLLTNSMAMAASRDSNMVPSRDLDPYRGGYAGPRLLIRAIPARA